VDLIRFQSFFSFQVLRVPEESSINVSVPSDTVLVFTVDIGETVEPGIFGLNIHMIQLHADNFKPFSHAVMIGGHG
jgi:hypothetical protein